MNRAIRQPMAWLAGIVAIGTVLTAVTFYRNHDSDPSPIPPGPLADCIATPNPWSTNSSTEPPTGIHVEEEGHTPLGNPAHPTAISIGAMLRNSTDHVAYQTDVLVTVTDRNAENALYGASETPLHLWIPVILPGEDIGVGVTRALISQAAAISTAEIHIISTHWLSPSDDEHPFAATPVTYRSMSSMQNTLNSGTIAYTTTSHYCKAVSDHGTATVFRNNSGTIIGGSLDYISSSAPPEGLGCRPGVTYSTIYQITTLPTGLDTARTAGYAYCDPASENFEIKGVLNYSNSMYDSILQSPSYGPGSPAGP